MTAFVAPFHHMKQLCGAEPVDRAWRHGSGSALADSSARFCIEMWRAEAVLLWHDREAVAVPIRHMTLPRLTKHPEYRLESDAGPAGIGAVVFNRDGAMLAYTSYRLPWVRDGKNKFQNQREYVGLLVALILLHRVNSGTGDGVASLRRQAVEVKYTGDNTTAQAWIAKAKCSSRCGQLSCMAVTWMQIHSQLRIYDNDHKEGLKMGFVDDLSRFRATPQLDPVLYVDLERDAALTALLVECDPHPESHDTNVMNHHAAFAKINETLLTIIHAR